MGEDGPGHGRQGADGRASPRAGRRWVMSNHYSLPCGPDGAKINCLWECQTEDAASKFQDFIDNDATSPARGTFTNDCYRAMPEAHSCRRRALPILNRWSPRRPRAPSSGCSTRSSPMGPPASGARSAPRSATRPSSRPWSRATRPPASTTTPLSRRRPAAPTPWSASGNRRPTVLLEEFQAFIDNNDIAPGDAFLDNAVYKMAPGAQVPSAMFPAESRGARAARVATGK